MTNRKSDKTAKAEKKDKGTVVRDEYTGRNAAVLKLFRTYPNRSYTIKSLAALSGGADSESRRTVQRMVGELVEQGLVSVAGKGRYRLSLQSAVNMEGIVDMTSSGSLYISVEGEEQDVFVNARNAGHALDGDKVSFSIIRTGRGGVPEGRILSVIERSERNYVGVAQVSENYAFVKTDSRKMPADIFVRLDGKMEIKDGEKVLVRIADWPDTAKNPEGRITDVFGAAGDNDAEMHAILAEYDLPYHFEPKVEKAAKAIRGTITEKDYKERRDMRDVTTFTIDPADAKDFDDALSVRKLPAGTWEVGVHIADVTHYVTLGSAVDTEAENRTTSVYLVDRTVPMLPERLSNELCSLRPNEEKLTFSAIFEMDDSANVVSEWFGRTVIISDKRFTYEQAQSVIETGEGELKEEILTLNSLARIMRDRRFKSGAITFEKDEAKFKLDSAGKPLGVYFKKQKESNQLIEEFMLLANRKVAEFVGKKQGKGGKRTFVYRVHDDPDTEKLANFKDFIIRFGYFFRAEKGRAVAKEMNKLMENVKGRYEENVISTLAIRTMAKAYYSTDNIGHYGLALDYYTHFTSPIRRYPDIMVHRLLASYLEGGKSPGIEHYEQLCEHCSQMEVRASEAERSSVKYKMVEFMLDKIGMEFDGHISGVTDWGVYVELDESRIEGMVSLRDMTDDYYSYNAHDCAVKGDRTGRSFALGDGVRVKLIRADLSRKQIDFQMTASYEYKSGKAIPLEEPRHVKQSVKRGTSAGKGSGKKRR